MSIYNQELQKEYIAIYTYHPLPLHKLFLHGQAVPDEQGVYLSQLPHFILPVSLFPLHSSYQLFFFITFQCRPLNIFWRHSILFFVSLRKFPELTEHLNLCVYSVFIAQMLLSLKKEKKTKPICLFKCKSQMNKLQMKSSVSRNTQFSSANVFQISERNQKSFVRADRGQAASQLNN